MSDLINHPPHYQTSAGIEAIEVMERYDLGLHLGSAMKYLLRAGRKGSKLDDLKKAQWYVHRYREAVKPHIPHAPEAENWHTPEAIADAFDLQRDSAHRYAVLCLLEFGVDGDKDDLIAAEDWLISGITREEQAAA